MLFRSLCAKVYGATLPLEEPAAPSTAQAAIISTGQVTPAANDVAAAAQLRALGRDAAPFRSGELLRCHRRVDLGLVGEPDSVDVEPIRAAWNAGQTWYVVVGALLSVVGLFYYMRVARAMYVEPPKDTTPIPVGRATLAAIVIAAVAGMIDFRKLRRLWDARVVDFWLAAGALAGVSAWVGERV